MAALNLIWWSFSYHILWLSIGTCILVLVDIIPNITEDDMYISNINKTDLCCVVTLYYCSNCCKGIANTYVKTDDGLIVVLIMIHVFIMAGRSANNYMCMYAPVGGMVDQLVYCNTRYSTIKMDKALISLLLTWDNKAVP